MVNMIEKTVVTQFAFLLAIGKLVGYAANSGWLLTLGEGYTDINRLRGALKDVLGRWPTDDELAHVYGHKLAGQHPARLAQDLNLYKFLNNTIGSSIGWTWIRTYDAAWDALGTYWKSLDPRARWGGDFTNEKGEKIHDYNHFEFRNE